MQAYRKAIAGALVTIGVILAAQFGYDVSVHPGLEASIVTLVIFVLGFVPLKDPEAEDDVQD